MPAELKFEDSNLAGIGSDLDASLRKSAADSESEFDDAGSEEGVEIWRIEKFEAKKLDRSEHGQFYSGDAYIVLHTYMKADTDKLFWNLHFFLGKDSTQDERGAAAYLTVNLDDKLNGGPVQYREVEGSESKEFLSLFPVYTTIDGGVASGFTPVEPEAYTSRLLHVYGPSGKVRVAQVPMSVESLNMKDVFILDGGMKLYQWNSSGSSPFERMRASSVREKIQSDRDGQPEEIILESDDLDSCHEWWAIVGEKGEIKESAEDAVSKDNENTHSPARKLYTVSDETGEMEVTLTEKGEKLSRDMLSTDDISVVVSTSEDETMVYLYAGARAGPAEKFYMVFSTEHILSSASLSPDTPTRIVSETATDMGFEECFQ